MARLWLLALCATACLALVAASPSVDFDESALLAELGAAPAASEPASLLGLNDLSSESMALLEADAKDGTAAAELMHESESILAEAASEMKAKADAAAAAKEAEAKAQAEAEKANKAKAEKKKEKKAAAAAVGERNGKVAKGVDVWTVSSPRGVFTKPQGGAQVGNILANTRLVIQEYKTVQVKGVETVFGYGYVTSSSSFGGWFGSNACGWFPLQSKGEDEPAVGELVKNIPNHPPKCRAFKKVQEKVRRSNLFKANSFLRDGRVIRAITNKECTSFLNYDPKTATPVGPAPSIAAGTFSAGKKALGSVPSGVTQRNGVKGFGLSFVTKDGQFALVKYPNLDPANPTVKYFFVAADCLQFDVESVVLANKVGGASLMETESSEEPELEAEAEETEFEGAFGDEFAAMEVHSEEHESISSPSRGNYPGWNSMIEIHLDESPAAAPAPAQGNQPSAQQQPSYNPKNSPVLKNLPPEGPNVKHIVLGAGDSAAKLRDAGVGISKVHVHVFGKADADADKQRRLQSLVRRLADNQSEAYRRVNALLLKLKKCARTGRSDQCLPKITDKLEDFKAEWLSEAKVA